jgi:crotonobetaine/carnitine-CoA ligase
MDADARIPDAEECVTARRLERWARERPSVRFLEFADLSGWTFADTLARVRRAAGGLRRLGVRHGDHVLAWLPNSAEAVVTWLAANWLGAAYVPLNTGYRGRLLEHAIAVTRANVLVVHRDFVARLADVAPAAVRHAVVVGARDATAAAQASGAAWASVDGDRVRDALPRSADDPGAGACGDAWSAVAWHAWSALDGAPDAAAVEVAPWDTLYVILTSGTTGPSKAVRCTYVQGWVSCTYGMRYFDANARVLANLPLFHVSGAGAVLDRLTKGGTCVLVDGFSPSAFWDTVRRHRVTGGCLVGAMTQFLLGRPADPADREHTLSDVVTVPWNADSRALAERHGLRMHTAFNMTETAVPIVSEANPAAIGTCGRARPGVEARVVDAHDAEVPDGTVGELILRCARPWELAPEYVGNAVATADAWRNGWFHTGDAVRRDAAGNFYFVDRLKDSIRRRGENVSSFEVEAEALRHPAVLEAAAVAVPSAHGEDEVLLVVTAQPGAAIDPRELLAFLAPRMAAFMLPRYVRVVPAMPKTPTAKIEKHRLRGEGVTADTWDREAHGIVVRRGALIGLE